MSGEPRLALPRYPRINPSRQIRVIETSKPQQGMWWLPRDPNTQVVGTLSIDSEHRCTLNLLGKFSELPAKSYSVIFGQTIDGRAVSLHGMVERGGSMWTPSGQSFIEFQGTHTYIGAWFETPDSVQFSYFGATIHGLVDWLRERDYIAESWSTDEKSVTLTSSAAVSSDCAAVIDGISVQVISLSPVFSSSRDRQIVFKQVAAVRMRADAPLPISTYLTRLHDLQSLLWLLLLRPATIEGLVGEVDQSLAGVVDQHAGKAPVNIYIHGLTRPSPKERAYSLTLLESPDIAPIFADVFGKWVALRDELPVVSQLFFLPHYGLQLYSEARFLGLVQACEAYARQRFETQYLPQDEWIEGPYCELLRNIPASLHSDLRSSLRSRLRYAYLYSFRKMLTILVENTPAVRDRLIRCPGIFAQDVALLRNFHVHVAAELKAQVEEVPPIEHMIDYLEILLHARMLMDIGLGEEEVLERLMSKPYFDTTYTLRHYFAPLRKAYRRSATDS